jgi:hypothetical protein
MNKKLQKNLGLVVIGLCSVILALLSVNFTNILLANINHCTVGYEMVEKNLRFDKSCFLFRGTMIYVLWILYFIVWFYLINKLYKLNSGKKK